MNVYNIIEEQFLSFWEQKKESDFGGQEEAEFLKKANILLTIDRYIDELANLGNINLTDIQSLKTSWSQLLQNVTTGLSPKMRPRVVPVTQIP